MYCEILYKRNKGISTLVLKVIKATVQSHGFNGFVGLCKGHPLVEPLMNPTDKTVADSKAVTEMAAVTEKAVATDDSLATGETAAASNSSGDGDLNEWFKLQLSAGVTTKRQLFAAIQRDQKKGLVVSTEEDTEVSPLPESSVTGSYRVCIHCL